MLNPNHYSQGLTLNNPLRPAEHCIQTVQEGLETKWARSVTILSLVAKLPKKVIPKKIWRCAVLVSETEISASAPIRLLK